MDAEEQMAGFPGPIRPTAMVPAAAVPPAVAPSTAAHAVRSGPARVRAARLSFAAEYGAWPVGGRSGRWQAPDAVVRVWEHEDVLRVDAKTDGGRDTIRVELCGAAGTPLTPGLYRDVRHRYGSAGQPGILIVSNGARCTDDYAIVRIARLDRVAGRGLTALDASIVHRCGSESAPALRAHVYFRA